jgi:hypothetical protein
VISVVESIAPAALQVVCCDVAGYATQKATADAITALRQTPSPLTGEPLPAAFWKHADEQTVVGLTAVFQAISRHKLDPTRFTDWGILAAPRFLGRAALAVALNRFALEGAWGISPHLIPHRSLHSISGTVSQALKIQGPNFGVGGGPNAAGEALLVAGGMIADERLPGVWVILTGYEPELAPTNPAEAEQESSSSPPPAATAVALALRRGEDSTGQLRLRLGCEAGLAEEVKKYATASSWPTFSLQALTQALDGPAPEGCWRLRGGWAVLESPEVAEN